MPSDAPENRAEPPRSADNVAAGLLLAMAGFAGLSIGDAIIKSIAGAWPGTAVAMLRYVIGTAGLFAALLAVEGRKGLRVPLPWVQLGRGVAVALSAVFFFSALFLMPLADATSIQFTSPILAALFSALILKERMPRAAWLATVAAFAGVLLVLRPNVAALGWGALLPVGTATGMALMLVLNRMVARAGSVLLMQFLISAAATPVLIVATVAGHLSGWEPLHVGVPDWTVVLKVAIVAFSATMSHMLIYLATTRASAALTAPMTYIQLLVALALGIAVYGDYPDPTALAGAALIVGAGLWLWRRQRRRIAPAPA